MTNLIRPTIIRLAITHIFSIGRLAGLLVVSILAVLLMGISTVGLGIWQDIGKPQPDHLQYASTGLDRLDYYSRRSGAAEYIIVAMTDSPGKEYPAAVWASRWKREISLLGDHDYAVLVRAGWPCWLADGLVIIRSNGTVEYHDLIKAYWAKNVFKILAGRQGIPIRPMWGRLMLAWAFVAAIMLTLLFILTYSRILFRLFKNKCGECGYPSLVGSARCPECGSVVVGLD